MMNQLMKLGTGPQKALQLGIALQTVMHHLLAGLAQELLQELMQLFLPWPSELFLASRCTTVARAR